MFSGLHPLDGCRLHLSMWSSQPSDNCEPLSTLPDIRCQEKNSSPCEIKLQEKNEESIVNISKVVAIIDREEQEY